MGANRAASPVSGRPASPDPLGVNRSDNAERLRNRQRSEQRNESTSRSRSASSTFSPLDVDGADGATNERPKSSLTGMAADVDTDAKNRVAQASHGQRKIRTIPRE
jgi:xanthine dehydrogenase iron-sulfur cluster and FAD-binding subunit A